MAGARLKIVPVLILPSAEEPSAAPVLPTLLARRAFISLPDWPPFGCAKLTPCVDHAPQATARLVSENPRDAETARANACAVQYGFTGNSGMPRSMKTLWRKCDDVMGPQ